MIRRYFLFQVLLGWLLTVAGKIGILNTLQQTVAADLRLIDDTESEKEPMIFFVATTGNDAWSGRQAIPNKDFSDGPFASWERVQRAIRELRLQFPQLNRPIKVIFDDGTYWLTKPIIFTPEDSGTKLSPVTYEAAHQKKATFSGGQIITGWQEKKLNNQRLWTVNLPTRLLGVNFQHLWVNGKRRSRSRYPREGYLKVKALTHRQGQRWIDGHRSFEYYEADIPRNIDLKGGEAVVMNRWVDSRMTITGVDHEQQTLHFDQKSVFQLAPYDFYYLENIFGCLDTPGDWYLDQDQSLLYYLPQPEESIDSTEVVAPILSTLIEFKGEAIENRLIGHLRFHNLTFAHTDWHLPEGKSGYTHNAWGVSGAIVANGINDCHWLYCTFKHLGNHGIELFRGCQYNQIIACSLYDLGAGGIKIGEQKTNLPDISQEEVSHHNIITHNHVYDGGKFFPSAVGIRTVHSHNNLIAYNHVHDLYYTAISVRGTWGFRKTQAYENLVEHNYIHHIGKLSNGDGPIISDMGGIYNLGRQDGTIIRHNKIHDINGLRYGGWGIYLDEGSSFVVAEHNLVYRTSHGGFSQHYGRENLIRHNIFAFGKHAQIYRNKRDLKTALEKDFISFNFENNIIYWQEGKFTSGLHQDFQSHAIFNHNIYWKLDPADFLLGSLSWEEWQKRDRYSQIIDPLFVAPHQDNFQLQSNSYALKLGFNKYLSTNLNLLGEVNPPT